MEELNAQLSRGKKWLDVKKKAEFDNDKLTLDWLPTQEAIVKDMKAYEEYINSKSKGKK